MAVQDTVDLFVKLGEGKGYWYAFFSNCFFAGDNAASCDKDAILPMEDVVTVVG